MSQFFTSDAAKIICLLAGIVLMGIETLIPGFGIAGLSGFALMIVGTVCMWIQHGMLAGLITLLCALLLTAVEGCLALRSVTKGRLSRSELILNAETGKAEEHIDIEPGDSGKTVTVLNPVGFAEINGSRVEVLSEAAYIEKDAVIKVVSIQGKKVIVNK